MTNNEIIYSEAIAAGIYTQEQADAILAIKTRLWKYTTQPTKAAREAAELAGKEPDADPHYYLAPAYLFTAAQVQPTEDRKHKS